MVQPETGNLKSIPARVGVFGGAFSPPTNGHRMVIEASLAQLELERLLVIPTGNPPHKQLEDDPGAHQRFALCQAAFGRTGCELVSYELERSVPSYTVETLELLANPERDLVLIIGTDQLLSLPNWSRPERVCELVAEIAVCLRPGYELDPTAFAQAEALGAHLRSFEGPEPIEMSSTLARQLLRAGAPDEELSLLLDRPVLARIREHGLYGSAPIS